MPFDTTPLAEPIVYTGDAAVLDEALRLLGPNGEHWYQGGARCGDRMCVATALSEAIRDDDLAYNTYARLHFSLMPYGDSIPTWNDDPYTTFADVRQKLEQARDRLHRGRR